MADERLIFPVGFDLESGVKDVSEEWKRVQKQMQAAIDSRPISVRVSADDIKKFNTFVDRTYASLEALQDKFPEVFKETKDGDNITKQFQAMETSINAVNAEMRNLEAVWNNLSMEEKFDKDGNLTTKAQELKRAYVELYESQKTQGQTLSEITKEAIALADKQIEQARRKKAAEEEMVRLLGLEENTLANIRAKQSVWMSKLSTTEIGSEEWKNAVAEVQRLDAQIKKLQNTIKGSKGKTKIDIDTSTFAGKLKDLENRWKALMAAQRKGAEGEALRNEWRQLSAEAGNYISTLRSAVAAQDRLSTSQDRSTKAIKKQTIEYSRQMNYIERLITRIGLYTGIYAAAGMIRNIRETTAEFELQEVALGAIVQDAHAAAELFSQIKEAAVESPYQIKELVTYTKQLAAYGFEQNELFDTTMRLADISAGLGADMSRIILAVGQISAATVLKGTELRQLTELGIPMVELLAKKFTQLRGEVVTTGEVFEMISDKAVSFKMVEEILNDLTDAGGMFYDMQKKQAYTLAGQWSNLKDTISIAYDEIGNTRVISSVMTGWIDMMKGLIDRWEGLSNVIGMTAGTLAIYYAKNSKFIQGAAASRKAIINRIKAEKASEAQVIKTLAKNRELETSEKRRLLLSKQLTRSDYARVITESELSKNQAVRLALMNRGNEALLTALIRTKTLTAAEVAQIKSMGRWSAAWATLKLRMAEAGITMKAIGTSLMSFLPIAAISSAIQLIGQAFSASANKADAVEKVNKAYEEQELQLYRIENAYNDLNKALASAGDADQAFAKTTYGKKIEQLQKLSKMLERFGLGAAIDFSVLNIDNIDAVFNTWNQQLKDANALSKDWGSQLALTAQAFERTIMGWSIAGENLNSDMKDLTRSYNKLISNKAFRKDLERMREYVNEMANGYDEVYKRLTEAVGQDAKLALGQKRRNETEYQYQMRIMNSYEAIRKVAEGATDSATEFVKRFGDGTKAFFTSLDMSKFQEDLAEIMHEFNKTTGFFEGQDPVTIRMAIDDQWAINEWADWQKEAFIEELNKDRAKLELELIPTLSSDSVKEVQKGWKSILATEFPTFFDKEELSNMGKLSDVVDAIEEKMKKAAESIADAEKSTNKLTKDSESYKRVLTAIDDQRKLANEEREKGKEMDAEVVHTAFSQMEAIVGQNALYDEQIAKRKEIAKQEFELAKAVKDRLLAENMSIFGKDFKVDFPELMIDEFRKATDANYNTDFLVSDEDLNKMGSVLDIYSLWEKNVKAISDAREKMYGVGVSEEKIAEEQARIDARRAEINKELAAIDAQIAKNDFKAIVAKRTALAVQLSQTTDAKERKRIEEEILSLESDQQTAEAAKLAMKKQVLEASLNETNNAEAINKSIEEYVNWLNQAEGLWEKIRQKFNFNPLSGLAQDIASEFPNLLEKNAKGAKGITVPVDFLLSEKDLQGIWNAIDVADVFEGKIKSIEAEIAKANKTKLDPAIDEETRENAELYAQALELVYQNLLKAQSRYVQQYSDISKDIQHRFPQLMQNTYKAMDRETYSTKGLFSMDDLRGIEDYVDLYSLWEKKLTGVTGELEHYNKELSKDLHPELKQQILSIIASLGDEKKALEEMGKVYGFLLKQKGGAGSYNDDWLILWKNRMSFMKDFQQGVENLSKKMQEVDALASEQDIMRFRGKSVKINVEDLTGSPEELSKWYDDAIAQVMKKIKKMGGKPFEGLGVQAILAKDTKSRMIKAYQELLQELFNAKTDFETKQLEENLKKEIDRLATAVSRSKEARDFYDKMLGMTGDRQLSADLTMSVYGGVGDDLKENIKRQLTEAFKGVDITDAISGKNIDYRALEKLIGTLPQDMQANARKIVEEGIKSNAEIIQDLYKTLIKFEDYESKRVTILRNGIEERRRIEQADLAQSEKDRLKAASQAAESKALAKLEYEDFKSSDMYITMFENLDYVSSDTLRRMREKLLELKTTMGESLDPTQLKEIVTKMEDIDAELSRKNPFKTLSRSIQEYKDEYGKISKKSLEKDLLTANEERDTAKAYADAKADAVLAQEEMVRLAEEEYGVDSESAAMQRILLEDAKAELAIAKDNLRQKEETLDNLNDQARAWRNIKKAIKEAIEGEDGIVDWLNSTQSMLDSVKSLGEGMGAGEQFSGWMEALSGIVGGAGSTATGIGQILSGNWAQGLANVVKGVSEIALGIFDASYVNRVAAANAEIEKQEQILEKLDRAYQSLEKSAEDAFGTEYLDNYQDRLAKLYAMQAAYQAQADAERDKGKKEDEQATKDFEAQAREVGDQIAEMYGEISERLMSTDLGSAARDFADAWLEAYKTFGNTTDAIGEKFREMIDNMISESVIAGVMKTALAPVFKMIDNMSRDDLYNPEFWQNLGTAVETAAEYADVGATNAMRMLEAMGINLREMGAGLTGISKDIATASEESILGLAAGINTQNFYISQIHAAVLRMEMLMQNGNTGVNIQDLVTIQNQHLAYLPNIADNTANTLAECKAILVQVTAIADNLNRVISTNGSPSTHQLHITLS